MIRRRRDQVPPPPSCCSSFLPPIGRDRGETSLLKGLVDVQNLPFHLVEQLLGRLQALYQVQDLGFSPYEFRVLVRKPQATNETYSAFRIQDRAFSFPRVWIRIQSSRNHKTGWDRS